VADWKCVVKPNESAGTDSVFLCTTVDEALRAFRAIHNNLNGLGQLNDGALCQEFLRGTEFVIDGVSRDGVYKVVAIWEYDKRCCALSFPCRCLCSYFTFSSIGA
jgi:biotin carboxylase